MSFKKIIFVLVTLILMSCGNSSDGPLDSGPEDASTYDNSSDGNGDAPPDSGPFDTPTYTVTDVKVDIATVNKAENLACYGTCSNPIDLGQVVKFDAFLLEISGNPIFVKNTPEKRENNIFNISLFNTAYAYSPLPPFPRDRIEMLNITSTENFSDEYAAGTTLNIIFQIEFSEEERFRNVPPDIEGFIAIEPRTGRLLQLKLIQPPTLSKKHQFNVEYMYDNGEYFLLTTPLVSFE
ncbi:MAG: hypothetical protein V3T17_16585 [Pseudomonadales bacterium]